MADIKPIKPIKLCVNITIPTIDDDSISLYECVGILGNKLQETIQKINESLSSLEGAYTTDNPPPYPVTSVNGKTGAVVIDIPANVYTEDNPPPYPVTSVNRAETKDVITVFEPEGGVIEDVSQAELIAACKAGARLGAFNQDDGTCRLYHFNLYADPERVDYNEVAGGGASGVISVNDQTGAVNIFNAPISAATAESVTALNTSTNTKINQLKDEMANYRTAVNLLINSYFTNPVNQRGATSLTGVSSTYFIDRWVTGENTTVRLENKLMYITGSLYQHIVFTNISGKTLTFAVCDADGNESVCTFSVPVEFEGWKTLGSAETDYGYLNVFTTDLMADPQKVAFGFAANAEKAFKWAALYEGSYTAETLPPYVPKGYAAELAECQRYYQIRSANNIAAVDMRPTMRITSPTIVSVSGGYAYSADL